MTRKQKKDLLILLDDCGPVFLLAFAGLLPMILYRWFL
jgi:hypothetical protein